jgi:predicted RecB family endonuclease
MANGEAVDEITTLKVMAEQASIDLKVMQKVVEMLQKSLFGNGQPGIVQKLETRMETWEKRLTKIERLIYIAGGVFIAVKFLTENGVFSLKALIGH